MNFSTAAIASVLVMTDGLPHAAAESGELAPELAAGLGLPHDFDEPAFGVDALSATLRADDAPAGRGLAAPEGATPMLTKTAPINERNGRRRRQPRRAPHGENQPRAGGASCRARRRPSSSGRARSDGHRSVVFSQPVLEFASADLVHRADSSSRRSPRRSASSAARKCSSAEWSRDLTVPSRVPVAAAIDGSGQVAPVSERQQQLLVGFEPPNRLLQLISVVQGARHAAGDRFEIPDHGLAGASPQLAAGTR